MITEEQLFQKTTGLMCAKCKNDNFLVRLSLKNTLFICSDCGSAWDYGKLREQFVQNAGGDRQ